MFDYTPPILRVLARPCQSTANRNWTEPYRTVPIERGVVLPRRDAAIPLDPKLRDRSLLTFDNLPLRQVHAQHQVRDATSG
jgi:hypothetical protein